MSIGRREHDGRGRCCAICPAGVVQVLERGREQGRAGREGHVQVRGSGLEVSTHVTSPLSSLLVSHPAVTFARILRERPESYRAWGLVPQGCVYT